MDKPRQSFITLQMEAVKAHDAVNDEQSRVLRQLDEILNTFETLEKQRVDDLKKVYITFTSLLSNVASVIKSEIIPFDAKLDLLTEEFIAHEINLKINLKNPESDDFFQIIPINTAEATQTEIIAIFHQDLQKGGIVMKAADDYIGEYDELDLRKGEYLYVQDGDDGSDFRICKNLNDSVGRVRKGLLVPLE